ncbi:MAG: hypothetical protein IH838_06595 [Proteobacteria bacterium]|nr:hypothetical protein [Pseudomonadota bacterium]
MIKIVSRAITASAVSLFLVSAASAASGNSVDLLRYIPADTPYVFALTTPLPSKLADKLEPTVDELLQAYQRILRHAMAEQLVKMSSEEDAADDAEQFREVAEEVLSLMSLEGIRGAGIGRDSAFTLYGNGLLPVLRIELTDPDLFDAALARIEEKAGESLLIGETDGQPYKYAELENVKLLIATLDEQAIITAVPARFNDAQVAMALGVKKPRRNLKNSKRLRTIRKEYGFSDYFTGFIDNERIAEIFTGKATGLDNELFAVLDYQAPDLTETCSIEIMEMVGIVPRIVFGYSEITADIVESAMIIEMRQDIAEGLANVSAAVPGLGLDTGGLLSIGFGLNPIALREFYEARLDAMEADPYECENFADLQAGVAKGREVLNQPIPPVVYNFRGIVANIADIKGMDLSSKTPPESIDASILFAVENAESLITMAAMMDPQIAALNLLPDGKPVKLNFTQLAEIADEAFAAMSANALSIAIGEGAENNSASMLVAESADPVPILSINMNSARYYAMVGEAMAQESTDEDAKKMPVAVREAIRDAMMLSGSMYDRMSVDVRFTSRGVEIVGRMMLSD